jgi:hypothetical protein
MSKRSIQSPFTQTSKLTSNFWHKDSVWLLYGLKVNDVRISVKPTAYKEGDKREKQQESHITPKYSVKPKKCVVNKKGDKERLKSVKGA